MMNALTTLLFLIISSTNASKYLRPLNSYEEKEAFIEHSGGDKEGINLLNKLLNKLRTDTHEDWELTEDPRLYVLTEFESAANDANQDDTRLKRRGLSGPSLSIVNPLEVLQEKWLLELTRRQKAVSQDKIQKNRQILSSIGKRWYTKPSFRQKNNEISENQLKSNDNHLFRPYLYQT